MGQGVDLLTLPYDRFLNYVYWYLTKDADNEQKDEFDLKLWRPDPASKDEIPESSPWSAENETRAFDAFNLAVTGNVRKGVDEEGWE